jgi:hypothetical protein
MHHLRTGLCWTIWATASSELHHASPAPPGQTRDEIGRTNQADKVIIERDARNLVLRRLPDQSSRG